jgi:hypothetical protein
MAALVERVMSLAAEPVCTDRDANLAIENLWMISSTGAECAGIDAEALAGAIAAVARAWSTAIRSRGVEDDFVFYTWVDEAAGQLRCSAVLGKAARLPFACEIRLVHSPSVIATAFLSTPYKEGIPLAAFEPASGAGDGEHVLDVWAVPL